MQMTTGMMTKATSIDITLLMVNTAGYIYNWNQAPSWLHKVTTIVASTNQTYESDSLPMQCRGANS